MYPKELSEGEATLIRIRRLIAGTDINAPYLGVACSGGGIRSATLCLGAFQALARTELLRRVDYISTISGGGYFGSFLGSMYCNHSKNGTVPAGGISAAVGAELMDDQSPPLKWLRTHGRYIAPDGPADYANIAAIYIRNWFGVQYVVGITFLTLFLLLIGARGLAAVTCDANCRFVGWSTHLVGSVDVQWSPFLLIPVVGFIFVFIPLAWGFWLTQYPSDDQMPSSTPKASVLSWLRIRLLNNRVLWATMFVIVVCGIALWWQTQDLAETKRSSYAIFVTLVVGALAVISWFATELGISRRGGQAASPAMGLQAEQSLCRNLLSDWLGVSLKVLAILVGIAIVDSLAQTTYTFLVHQSGVGSPSVAISSVFTLLLSAVHQLAPVLQRSKGRSSTWSLWTIASAAGFVMLAIILTTWGTLAYFVAFHGQPILWEDARVTLLPTVGIGLVIGGILTILTAQTLQFLNLSSLQGFYSARLRRAYLGASNPRRTATGGVGARSATNAARGSNRELSIRHDVAGDDYSWTGYKPYAFGGPLHLMGVTVNHTIGKGSDIDLRDRKGFTMTIGPCGMSADIDSHALFEPDRIAINPLKCQSGAAPVFGEPGIPVHAEGCSLSRWMAISGAAFSTGLGANTRTGVSVLLGTANVRLGYWWSSGAKADNPTSMMRSTFRTQSYLLAEFLGRFAGDEYRQWYLSDGGHSENTGAYELIRRKLPLILLLDNGADPEYAFEDFGNLVRRVRIDFGAEILPLPVDARAKWKISGDIALPAVLGKLRRSHSGEMGAAVAQSAIALFVVSYKADTAQSLLILAKPTLTGDEPEDVMNYAASHPAFPQEPTSDQFFDEAQWESYRKLGQHIGAKAATLIHAF